MANIKTFFNKINFQCYVSKRKQYQFIFFFVSKIKDKVLTIDLIAVASPLSAKNAVNVSCQ